ncbi:MAG: Crp/Fnr family transcriptional regulator [Anaerolineales bacterium]|nr:Crp/Fnr family transcriptional regulator [Anaerolineales bacterium]
MTAVTAQHLREIPIFQDLPQDLLNNLALQCHQVDIHAGESLFHQGDDSPAFYLIEDGQLHVIRHYDTGEDIVLATFSPYEIIGEMSMFAQEPRTVKVVAVSDCVLVEITYAALTTLMNQHPAMTMTILTVLSKRLHRVNLLMHEFALGSPEARLANLVLLMADNATGPISINVRLQQMARAAGLDMGALNAILNEWVGRGYITRIGNQLSLMNVEAMGEIAGNAAL